MRTSVGTLGERTVTRLLLAFATLAGVLAMHGLDSEGAAAAEVPAAIHATHHGRAAPTGHEPAREAPDHDGGHSGLAGMCLAVLSGALLLGALLLAPRPSYAGHSIRRSSRRGPPRPRRAPPRPPDLFALSIQRC